MGAQNRRVSGWTAVVSQKSTQGTAKYRVGIVSAGPKVDLHLLESEGWLRLQQSSVGHRRRPRRSARHPGGLTEAESPWIRH